jgi:hypothetical protein
MVAATLLYLFFFGGVLPLVLIFLFCFVFCFFFLPLTPRRQAQGRLAVHCGARDPPHGVAPRVSFSSHASGGARGHCAARRVPGRWVTCLFCFVFGGLHLNFCKLTLGPFSRFKISIEPGAICLTMRWRTCCRRAGSTVRSRAAATGRSWRPRRTGARQRPRWKRCFGTTGTLSTKRSSRWGSSRVRGKGEGGDRLCGSGMCASVAGDPFRGKFPALSVFVKLNP